MQEGIDVERREKLDGDEIIIKSPFITWVQNFWYYHKWKLIIGLCVFFVIIYWTVSTLTAPTCDTTVLLGGPFYPTNTVKAEMYDAFSKLLPEDYDGDGEKRAEIVHYEFYSTEQFKELKAKDKDSLLNADNLKSFNQIVQIGEISVIITDKWFYDDLKETGAVRPLSEIFSGEVKGAIDEYAVRLSDTDLPKGFKCFATLPESTVIFMRSEGLVSGFFNKGQSDEEYKVSEALFKALLTYEYIGETE